MDHTLSPEKSDLLFLNVSHNKTITQSGHQCLLALEMPDNWVDSLLSPLSYFHQLIKNKQQYVMSLQIHSK